MRNYVKRLPYSANLLLETTQTTDESITEKREKNRHDIELFAIEPLHFQLNFENVTPFDEPDVIAHYNGKIIGIEVVGCHCEAALSNNRISYNKNKELVQGALKAYNKTLKQKGSRTSYVTVNWNETAIKNIPYKSGRTKIYKQIAKEIEDYLQNGDDADCYYIDSAALLDHGIEDCYMDCTAGWEERVNSESILVRIRQKEQKLLRYKQMAKNSIIDEYWLVVHFLFDNFKNINKHSLSETLESSYSRIYLTNIGEVVRIK